MNFLKLIISIFISVLIINIPYASMPIQWLSTYFHELSHAIMALILGGNIQELALDVVGSGHVIHSGSLLPFIVSFAGYCGPFIAAYILWNVGKNEGHVTYPLIAFISAIVLTTIFMVRDFETILVIGSIIGGAILFWKYRTNKYAKLIVQFISTLMLVKGYFDISYLINHPGPNDASSLSDDLFLPNIFWIGAWYLFGIFVTYFIVKSTFKKNIKRDPNQYQYEKDDF